MQKLKNKPVSNGYANKPKPRLALEIFNVAWIIVFISGGLGFYFINRDSAYLAGVLICVWCLSVMPAVMALNIFDTSVTAKGQPRNSGQQLSIDRLIIPAVFIVAPAIWVYSFIRLVKAMRQK